MDRVDGKITIVTGGSSGIGKAAALAFHREGARVVVADANVEGGEATVEMIKKAGGEAIFIKTDVSNPMDVESMVHKTIEAYGRIDCAFNNAGVAGERAPIADCSEENWDRVTSINLKGVWLCMKYEIPHMIKQRSGVIVNTSSVAGLSAGPPAAPAYTASKHGIVGLTKSAVKAYRKYGIRVNAVCPGLIRTQMVEEAQAKLGPRFERYLAEVQKSGLIGEPEDVAEAVVWLCSDAARFVNGHCLVIDGGLTCV